MKLREYRLIFVAAGLIGILLISSPFIVEVIRAPGGAQFSELYLLGPEGTAENYPYDIAVGQNYSVYVGVGNQQGSLAHYVLYVKFGNQTDQIPNATLGSPSPIAPLYEYRFSIPDGANWEQLLRFSVSHASIQVNNSQINTLQINDAILNVDKSAIWNSNSTIYTYQLFFELWLYNEQTGSVEFNNRYVNLPMNLTQTP